MADTTDYWQDFTAASGDLVFIKPQDNGGGVVFLSRSDAPDIHNDRDRALLRAYLNLALERLDREQFALLRPMAMPEGE